MEPTSTLPETVPLMADTAHSRRVAVYCDEISTNLRFSMRDRVALRQAALRHHGPFGCSIRIPQALAADLGVAVTGLESQDACEEILAHLSGRLKSANPVVKRLATVLEFANQFDEELEASPYGHCSLARALEDGRAHPAISFVLPHLRIFSRAEMTALSKHLPVFPAVAMEVIRCSRPGPVSLERLTELAGSDQSLAAAVLQAVNSAQFSVVDPIRDIRRAILYLGAARATDVIVTAAIKPLLMHIGCRDLWEHSLRCAELAEHVAAQHNICAKGEAYLLGLLHDVGRLLIRLVPKSVAAQRSRLIEKGCEPTIAEILTIGASHAEAGGDAVRFWGLPDEYSRAIHFHHEPEHSDSQLAALLYVVEHLSDSDEDLPSVARLNVVKRRLGLTARDLDRLQKFAKSSPYCKASAPPPLLR